MENSIFNVQFKDFFFYYFLFNIFNIFFSFFYYIFIFYLNLLFLFLFLIFFLFFLNFFYFSLNFCFGKILGMDLKFLPLKIIMQNFWFKTMKKRHSRSNVLRNGSTQSPSDNTIFVLNKIIKISFR